ncbi:D-hexose-6-phosphate mutarotase [Oxalobacteraceae bacterium]|nr:D-hexose-6-phosphate mutarotase [Oxalobacteraceae bacterium]
MSVVTPTEFGQLPALRISAPDGAQATVSLFGGHLLSWKSADGQERLFCSRQSALDGSKAIRGGVPVIFPQFNTRGAGSRHGFARTSTWRAGANGLDGASAWAEFELNRDDLDAATAAAWPHPFTLRLRFALSGASLDMTMTVHNTGAQDFPFGLALHTYFNVGQLDQAVIGGLRNVAYTDHLNHAQQQAEAELRFTEKLDRLYQAPETLTLQTTAGTLQLQQQGFADWVIWNPGAADAAALADMADEEYRDFVCIEPAIANQRPLAAGAQWVGRHSIQA